MRLMVDSNVWISGFATRGLCADLLRLLLRRQGGEIDLMICGIVRAETERILRDRFSATETDMEPVRRAMSWAREVPIGDWQAPVEFPDPNDVPILAAALDSNANWFVTGDRALLEVGGIEKLEIIDPRTAYQRLLGLN